jgi:uncharacterized protein
VRDQIGGSVTARVTWGNPATTFEELDDAGRTRPSTICTGSSSPTNMYAAIRWTRKAVLVQLIDKFFSPHRFELYPLIPLMGIVRNKLLPNRAQELYAGRTQCRVSTHLINVMPNGQIYPCPDMMYVPEMQMGRVQGNWLLPSPLQQTSRRCPAPTARPMPGAAATA